MSAPTPAEEKDLLINTDLSFNRFNDAYIKFLFASEAHKEFLLDLINAVFDDKRPACISGKVTDLTVEDRELFPQHQRDKQGRLDIRAETSSGEMIDIEVYTYTESLGPRSLSPSFLPHSRQRALITIRSNLPSSSIFWPTASLRKERSTTPAMS